MAQNTNDIVDEFEIDDVVGSDESSSFSRSKIGRFVAVALFLLLGTFAVIYLMSRPHDHAEHDHNGDGIGSSLAETGDKIADKTSTAVSSLKESTSAVADSVNKGVAGVGGKFESIAAAGKNAADKFASNATNSSKFSNNGFPKTKTSVAKTTIKTPPSSNFAGKASTTPLPKPFQPSGLPQPLRDKKPEPPARFAAAPGRPLIGSQGGFGELKKPVQPATASNRFGAPKAAKPTATTASSLIRKSGDDAKQLLGDLAKAPEVVRNKAAGVANSASNSFNGLTNQARRPFGNNQQTAPQKAGALSNRRLGAPPAATPTTNRFAQPSSPTTQKSNAFAGFPKADSPAKPTSTSSSPTSRFPSNLRPTTPPQQPRSTSNLTPIPTNTAANSNRRTLASTVARPAADPRQKPFPPAKSASSPTQPITRPLATPAKSSFGGYTGTSNPAGPAARVAARVTKDVPGDRRLDGVQAPSLSIEKLSPKEIQVGEPADFQIVIRNVGRIAVDDIRVFDQIPVGTEFISATPTPTQSDKRNLSWDIGTLSPGVEKRINVQLKPTRPGEIGSVAQYTFAARSSMRTRVTQPVLEITHRCNPKVLIGGDVLLDVVVTNKGDGPAKDVLIQEDVPEQLKFREGYREIEYEVGTLLPNQSRNVRLALKAFKPGKLKNVIHATGSGGLKSQHKLDLEVIAPKLKTTSSGPSVRFLGRNAKHTFNVANLGTAPATNVNLIARLPSGLRYLQSNNKGTYNRNTHAVLWELAQLGEGVDASVEVMTEPIAIGSQPIKFEASADLNIQDSTEQPLTVEHLVDLFIDIDDVLDPIEIGGETSYRVEVVNQGTKVATNVELQMSFTSGLKPSSVAGPLANQIRGQQIVFSPIESLKPGARLKFVVSAKGVTAGDHRVVLKMDTDGRTASVSKEESTRVYSDR